MFKPDYRITDYSLDLIGRAEKLATKINEANIAFLLKSRLQKEALNKNAYSSTSIEGNVLSLPQVVAISENRDVDSDLRQKKEVANYIESLRWIAKNIYLPITEKRLLNLHLMITRGLILGLKAGCYKQKQNYVMNEKKVVVYAAPGPKESPKLFCDLIKWVGRAGRIHPIIVSAVFHHQCVSIHPFSDGNGRLARAVSQWILYKRGFDPKHILSLDDFYAEDRKLYYKKIQQARDLDYDLTYWIEYVAQGVLGAIRKVYTRVSRVSLSSKKKIVVTPKQEELIEILNMQGALGSADIGKILKVNRARVNQIVSPLVKSNIIKKEGSARATRYSLAKK